MSSKLIIADDELCFSKSLFKYLKINNNFVDIVGIASNGEETLELIDKFNPDILLLDLQMPGINGIEILEKIKCKEILVILISGDIGKINEIKISTFQCVKQIYIKPFDFKKLNLDLIYFYEIGLYLDLKKNIENELAVFLFNKNSVGYNYIIECLIITYKKPDLLNNMEKELFNIVAKHFNLDNYKIIKWSIQKSLSSMIRYTSNKVLY